MSDLKLPTFTQEQIERGLESHIKASRSASSKRDAEVTAVLGFSPRQAFQRFERAATVALEKAGLLPTTTLATEKQAGRKHVAAMTAANKKKK